MARSNLKHLFPFLNWFPFNRETLKGDIAAGLTVAMLLIPQSMAYAELAGLPAVYGLYASFIPVILGALFGHLNQLAPGPSAMSSLITAAVLAPLAAPGSGDYIRLAILLALLVGLIRLLFGLFRLAVLVDYISHPVVAGFTNAGALVIALSQTGRLFGITAPGENGFLGSLRDFYYIIRHLPELHGASLLFGTGALILILVLRRRFPRLPGILITVIAAVIVSSLTDFDTRWGGAVVGVVPGGLPSFANPLAGELRILGADLVRLLPGAVLVTLISFMEVLSVSKAIAFKTRQPLDLNREMIGQGLASLGGAFFRGYTISGSFSRSAINLMSGARTGLSQIISGVSAAVVLLFLTPLFHDLPVPVLAAIIIMAVLRLIDMATVIRIYRADRRDFLVSAVTFGATLAAAPALHYGILTGVAVSFLLLIGKTGGCGRKPCRMSRGRPRGETVLDGRGVILTLEGRLTFTVSGRLELAALKAVDDSPALRFLLLDCVRLEGLDASGEWVLKQLEDQCRGNGITLALCGLSPAVTERLRRTGLLQKLPPAGELSDRRRALEFLTAGMDHGA